jgi:hypothetical protein
MKSKRNLILLTIIAVVSGVLTRVVIQKVFPRDDAAAHERQLAEAARELNAQAPRMLDAGTRLDGGKAGPGNRFTYNYTLTQLRSTDIDPAEWQRNVVPQIKTKMRNGVLAPMFKRGTTVVYRHSGSDGVLVSEIEMSPTDGLAK